MFDDIKDVDIFEYRKSKEVKYGNYCRKLRRTDTSIKKSVRTTEGYVDIYIYYPKKIMTDVVYFNMHGGGMCLAEFELDIPYCQKISEEIGCIVVNVDYLVAPEYKFPKSYTTTYEVLKYCNDNRDEFNFGKAKFVVGGNSAGGQIAAALVQLENEDNQDFIYGLVMNYAPCNQSIDKSIDVDLNKVINPNRIRQYQAWEYNEPSELNHPLSNLLNSNPKIYPPTLENISEFDSLRDGEEKFAQKLQSNGIFVDLKCYQGCQHGFTHENLKEFDKEASEDAWLRIETFLKKISEGGEELWQL